MAAGLRVPSAVGDFLMLRAIRESKGCAIAVTDDELMGCVEEMASGVGIFPAPEGAATLACLKKLVQQGWVDEGDRVVLKLEVAEEDKGKIIGRQGRVAQAMRVLLRVAAVKNDTRAVLEIV